MDEFSTLRTLQAALLDLKSSTCAELKALQARVALLEESQGEGKAVSSAADEECEDIMAMEYALNATTWDAPAIVGLPQLGGAAPSCLLLFAIFLNVAAQLFLVVVMETSGTFVAHDKWEQAKEAAARWRSNEGHEYRALDAGGSSLASRVCGLDAALSVAGEQSSMLGEINAYLNLAAYSTTMSAVATGPMLCGVCLFLFVVVILKDLRELFSYSIAVSSVPRGRTRIEGEELAAISRQRLAFIALLNVARLLVSLSLLYTGVMWLSATSSITDLILNAAALHFVMDLDELLFASIVPDIAQKVLSNLKPLPYRMPRMYCEATLPLLLTVLTVSLCVSQLVLPAAGTMLEVKREICGGNLDFVVTEASSGLMVTAPTLPYDFQLQLSLPSLKLRAVDELRSFVGGRPSTNYSVFSVDRESFLAQAQTSIDSASSEMPCEDLDVFSGGIALSEMPAWFTTVSLELGGLDSTWAPEQWRCSDFFANCSHSSLLRLICPVTCGCDDPRSGQIRKGKGSGCSRRCQERLKAVLANQSCDDGDVAGTPAWERWWHSYEHLFQKNAPIFSGRADFKAFVRRKIDEGCSNVERDPLFGTSFCDESAQIAEEGVETIQGFCTKTCCTALPRPANCPSSCGA